MKEPSYRNIKGLHLWQPHPIHEPRCLKCGEYYADRKRPCSEQYGSMGSRPVSLDAHKRQEGPSEAQQRAQDAEPTTDPPACLSPGL